MKRITVELSEECTELIRDFAESQKCTYRSAVWACVKQSLTSRPIELEPYKEGEVKKS